MRGEKRKEEMTGIEETERKTKEIKAKGSDAVDPSHFERCMT